MSNSEQLKLRPDESSDLLLVNYAVNLSPRTKDRGSLYHPLEETKKSARLVALDISPASMGILSVFALDKNKKSNDIFIEALASNSGISLEAIQHHLDRLLKGLHAQNLTQAHIFAELLGILPVELPSQTSGPLSEKAITWALRGVLPIEGDFESTIHKIARGESEDVYGRHPKFPRFKARQLRLLDVDSLEQAVRIFRERDRVPLLQNPQDILEAESPAFSPFTQPMKLILKRVATGALAHRDNSEYDELISILGLPKNVRYAIEEFVAQLMDRDFVAPQPAQRRIFQSPQDAIALTLQGRTLISEDQEAALSDDQRRLIQLWSSMNVIELSLELKLPAAEVNAQLRRIQQAIGVTTRAEAVAWLARQDNSSEEVQSAEPIVAIETPITQPELTIQNAVITPEEPVVESSQEEFIPSPRYIATNLEGDQITLIDEQAVANYLCEHPQAKERFKIANGQLHSRKPVIDDPRCTVFRLLPISVGEIPKELLSEFGIMLSE